MTARAGTEVEAANRALAELGEPPIARLDDNSLRARAVNANFGSVRDQVLREHDWNFATAWVQPAADLELAVGPLKNRYVMPADCLRVRFLQDLHKDDWAIEAGGVSSADIAPEAMLLVTNAATPLVCYTRRIEAPRLWDAMFLTAFAKRLAAAIAPTVARDKTAAAVKANEAEIAVSKAATGDAREASGQRVTRETSWVTARVVGVSRQRS